MFNTEYRAMQELVNNIIDCPSKGGNISVKDKTMFYIKSSGEDLKDNNHLISIFHNEEPLNAAMSKPSMEVGFHKELKTKYVLHYHPLYLAPFLNNKNFLSIIDKIMTGHGYFKNKYPEEVMSFVDYTEPGDELVKKIKKLRFQTPVIFLQNHGIILNSDSIEEIKELYYIIRQLFFYTDDQMFTPDDACLDDPELYIYKLAMQYIALKSDIVLEPLQESAIKSVRNNKDEKYRMEMKWI